MQRSRWGENQDDYLWQTLGEGLRYLENSGVSTNVGSFVGATTLRINQIGYNDRKPTSEEMDNMKRLTDEAMREGAMGLGTSLIYAPAFYANTDELIELAAVVGEYDGMYISHMRSEGNRLIESVDELIEISREAGVHAEIHHLKAAGRQNWDKLDEVIERVETARNSGQPVTANMYTYDAAATSLAAIFPPWTQDGGHSAWIERLKDPETREQIIEEIKTPTDEWENFYQMAGGGEGIILVGLRSDELQKYVGMTLSEVAAERGDEDEVRTAVDLTIEDNNRIGAIYYLMSEENVQRQIQLPWMSFGSDGGTFAAEGDVLNRQMHPRAWGNFARLLGKYVREEKLISFEEAIYRLTGLPATNLKLNNRGFLKEGYHADIVIFDPERIEDHATFENPHQYATGVEHVFVNGIQVLNQGEHTGEFPGRFVKGPGYYQSQN
jgi:N-acyl-D-amino-acid deacylase